MRYVFVYGTLRKEQGASYMLDDCEFLGKGSIASGLFEPINPATGEVEEVTTPILTVPEHGHYPAIVTMPLRAAMDRGAGPPFHGPTIRGEVYRIPREHEETISNRLDRYEGYPRLYGRSKVEVYMENGDHCEAYTYYMMLSPEHLEDFSVIRSGDWTNREDVVPFFEYVEERKEQRKAARAGNLFYDPDLLGRVRARRAVPEELQEAHEDGNG